MSLAPEPMIRRDHNPVTAPETPEELGKLYDEAYYRTGCGPVPYNRSEPQWGNFFGAIAAQLIRSLNPARVLDVGCALGFLVEAFWDRGVEAWGIDVSPYAIGQVRRDMQPYCKVASAADGIDGAYDLITCIEVLEHMPEAQTIGAIGHMTRAADTILFSSTPYDLDEPTHFNVRPAISWLALFQDHGFSPDLDFDASFVCSHAMLLRRRATPFPVEVLRLYAQALRQRHDIQVRDGQIHERNLKLDEAARGLQESSRKLGETSLDLQAAQQRIQEREREAQVLREQLDSAASKVQSLQQDNAAKQERVRALEEEIANANSLQDELRRELEALNQSADQLIAQREKPDRVNEALTNTATALRSQGAAIKALESRILAAEHRNLEVAAGLSGILESKIWRTLVRGGGFIQKLTGK